MLSLIISVNIEQFKVGGGGDTLQRLVKNVFIKLVKILINLL